MSSLSKVFGVFALCLLIILILLVVGVLSGRLSFDDGAFINPYVDVDPEKNYQLELWAHHFSLRDEYRNYLEQMIEEFQQLYPQVEVKYRLFSPLEEDKALEEALAEASPPDLYLNWWGPMKFHSLQLPVQHYLSREEESMLSEGLEGIVVEEKGIWSWPSLQAPLPWLASKELIVPLLNRMGLNLNDIWQEGWSWEELEFMLQEIESEGERVPLIYLSDKRELSSQLLINSSSLGDQRVLSELEQADPDKWEEAEKMIDRFLGDNEELVEEALHLLWSKKLILLAGSNYNLTGHLLSQQEQQGVQLVVLPPPGPGKIKNNRLPFQLVRLTAFRQRDYQGDDHTRAVMELGRFISRSISSHWSGRGLLFPLWELPDAEYSRPETISEGELRYLEGVLKKGGYLP